MKYITEACQGLCGEANTYSGHYHEKKTLAKRNINSLSRESEKLKHRKKKYVVRGHGPRLRKITHKYWILSDLAAEQYICITIYVKKKQKGKF